MNFGKHMETHESNDNYTCSSCSAKVPTVNKLIIHWFKHNVKPFHCIYCSYSALSVDEVGRHQAEQHPTMSYCMRGRISTLNVSINVLLMIYRYWYGTIKLLFTTSIFC